MTKVSLSNINPYIKWGVFNFVILLIVFSITGGVSSKKYGKETQSFNSNVKDQQQSESDMDNGISQREIVNRARMAAINDAKQRITNDPESKQTYEYYSKKVDENSVPVSKNASKVVPLNKYDITLKGIKLNAPHSSYSKGLGSPLKTETYNENTVYTYSNGLEIAVNKGLIQSVTVDTPSAHTERGIQVGSKVDQVISEYGPANITTYGKYDMYEYFYEGNPSSILRFAINQSNKKVEYIGVRLNL